jgi:hypothetical protein
MATARVGDAGTIFRLTIRDQDGGVVNLSGATLTSIIFYRPDGSQMTKIAEFYTDGTDGIIQYVALASDLNRAGDWKIEGRVVLSPTQEWTTTQAVFGVL